MRVRGEKWGLSSAACCVLRAVHVHMHMQMHTQMHMHMHMYMRMQMHTRSIGLDCHAEGIAASVWLHGQSVTYMYMHGESPICICMASVWLHGQSVTFVCVCVCVCVCEVYAMHMYIMEMHICI